MGVFLGIASATKQKLACEGKLSIQVQENSYTATAETVQLLLQVVPFRIWNVSFQFNICLFKGTLSQNENKLQITEMFTRGLKLTYSQWYNLTNKDDKLPQRKTSLNRLFSSGLEVLSPSLIRKCVKHKFAITQAVISHGNPQNEMARQWVLHLRVLSRQSWIQASQRKSYPLAHLIGDFYFSSETLLVFREHWATRLLPFPCVAPKVSWPQCNSVENRLWSSALTQVFKNKHLYVLWLEASTSCSIALNKFPLPLKINQLGSF